MSKSKEKKTFKKSRNSYVKTSRTKNEINLYEESMASSKSKQAIDYNRKLKNPKHHGKLKINIKPSKGVLKIGPQTTQGIKNTEYDLYVLKDSKTFHENLRDQRQGLMDRMHRIESIISFGKSYDRDRDENFDPITTQNEYYYQNQQSFSPSHRIRSAISPAPSSKINL